MSEDAETKQNRREMFERLKLLIPSDNKKGNDKIWSILERYKKIRKIKRR